MNGVTGMNETTKMTKVTGMIRMARIKWDDCDD